MSGSGSVEDFIKDIDNFNNITWGKVNKIIKYISIDLFQSVIEDTPKDTWRSLNSWHFTVDIPSRRKPNEEVDENGDPIETYPKNSVNVVTKMKNGLNRAVSIVSKTNSEVHRYYLTNNTSYIIGLEYGHSELQAPDGMARKNVQRFSKMNLTKYAIKAGK